MVYIDPNVYNYTEVNDAIRLASDDGIFGDGIVTDVHSCMKQLPYMICQSVYPRCNSTTQALLPVCVDDCIAKTDTCSSAITALETSASLHPLYEMLAINCTDQFRTFESVTVDSESCYNYYGKVYCR